jgi:hypothetical protein
METRRRSAIRPASTRPGRARLFADQYAESAAIYKCFLRPPTVRRLVSTGDRRTAKGIFCEKKSFQRWTRTSWQFTLPQELPGVTTASCTEIVSQRRHAPSSYGPGTRELPRS